MTQHTLRPGPALTLVTAPGCHFCEDAHRHLEGMIASGVPLQLRVVEATSAEGRSLLAEHRPAMNPLLIVDGTYFSAGRLPRRKLDSLLSGTPGIGAGRG
ncbi:hypothetical protein PROP_02249 [Propionicimonas sp. T2.31MG-18]|uniref:glutaredoxin n=1 Tax=Propionicimonas sp. T2.31MG-18 TaxID=3157620 RepID=UPI0035EC64C0